MLSVRRRVARAKTVHVGGACPVRPARSLSASRIGRHPSGCGRASPARRGRRAAASSRSRLLTRIAASCSCAAAGVAAVRCGAARWLAAVACSPQHPRAVRALDTVRRRLLKRRLRLTLHAPVVTATAADDSMIFESPGMTARLTRDAFNRHKERVDFDLDFGLVTMTLTVSALSSSHRDRLSPNRIQNPIVSLAPPPKIFRLSRAFVERRSAKAETRRRGRRSWVAVRRR